MSISRNRIHALLFGLNPDLAGELLRPLAPFCSRVDSVVEQNEPEQIADSAAQLIFCSADSSVVAGLRNAKPAASIVVVSRFPEVSTWLDSIEAGASDYCAAPFESAQLRWIVDSSIRSARLAA